MSVQINVSGLKKLKKALSDNYVTYVGILGSEATQQHKDSSYTNAQIGAVQEFGSVSNNIPARSFIRMPLEMKIGDWISKHSKEYFDMALNGNLEEFYRKVGTKGEEIIQDAFDSRGFGQWAANAPSTVKAKGSNMPLVDTGILRSSIASEVVREDR